MIYEIFKEFATDGLTWGEFAIATVSSAYIIYISMWIIGWAVS